MVELGIIRAMRGRWVLLAEAALTLLMTPFLEEPLLQTACVIAGLVSVYSAFYLTHRLWLYGLAYPAILGAVALFTLSSEPLGRFAGWEGVSVIAWALIAYGRGNAQRSLEAAFIGFSVNRLGDAFWIASLLSPDWKWGFVIGGWVKAALFPMSFWLVQVMYAPIPVSALLHSALLVALGVYGPIQTPTWLEGLPLEGIRAAAEVAALASAVGAFFARVPKSTLAWTTSAHLALAAALWVEPPLAQKALLSHAYLKAALFLLLGLVQKSLRWNPLLKLAWMLATLTLAIVSTPTSFIALIAETLTAFALARLWNSYPTSSKLRVPWIFFAPLTLILVGLIQSLRGGLAWHLEGIVPVLGVAAGLLARWPKKAYRVDRVFLILFSYLVQIWDKLAIQAQKTEERLLSAYDSVFMGFLRLMRVLARREDQFIDLGWRPLVGYLRRALAAWVIPFSARESTYQATLQWAFLLSLLIFVVWRYFF